MNLAEYFADKPSSVLDKVIGETREEEVGPDDAFRDRQSILSLLKVELAVKVAQEAGDRIRILVFLHLDNACYGSDMISLSDSGSLSGLARDDSGGNEIPEQMRGGSLDGVEVVAGEEHVE